MEPKPGLMTIKYPMHICISPKHFHRSWKLNLSSLLLKNMSFFTNFKYYELNKENHNFSEDMGVNNSFQIQEPLYWKNKQTRHES